VVFEFPSATLMFLFFTKIGSQVKSKGFKEVLKNLDCGGTQQHDHEFQQRSKPHLLTLSLTVGFSDPSPFCHLPPPTPGHPSKPLQQFTHLMAASGIILIQELMCATASRVRVFINVSIQFTRFPRSRL
jgi:hypothetical protein